MLPLTSNVETTVVDHSLARLGAFRAAKTEVRVFFRPFQVLMDMSHQMRWPAHRCRSGWQAHLSVDAKLGFATTEGYFDIY